MWSTPNCPDGGNFTKRGWWVLEPGQCTNIFNRNLADVNRYYYVYADAPDGKVWSGNYIRAVPDFAFQLCEWVVRNPSRNVGFQQVDIGDNDDFTLTLTV